MARDKTPRLSCCLTYDFDAMSLWIGSFATNNVSMLSRGEFGAIGAKRLLDLLKSHDIRTTWCIPGHTVYAYPDLIRRIRDEGHEIAHHGWVHENPVKFSREEELRNLQLGFEAFDRVAGVRPKGYRSPAWDISPNTIDLLLENGFAYDSSCMGNDFYPYYLRKGDQWPADKPYVFGEMTELVEVPVTWGLDDFPPFEYVWGQNTGLSAPSAVEEIWKGDFDYAYEHCPGGIYNLTMHPQVIGRGHRMLMLERLIDHFKKQDGVVFETVGEYVERWRSANPLEKWKAENPHYVGPTPLEPSVPGARRRAA